MPSGSSGFKFKGGNIQKTYAYKTYAQPKWGTIPGQPPGAFAPSNFNFNEYLMNTFPPEVLA
jgi:hypothetical protein